MIMPCMKHDKYEHAHVECNMEMHECMIGVCISKCILKRHECMLTCEYEMPFMVRHVCMCITYAN